MAHRAETVSGTVFSDRSLLVVFRLFNLTPVFAGPAENRALFDAVSKNDKAFLKDSPSAQFLAAVLSQTKS